MKNIFDKKSSYLTYLLPLLLLVIGLFGYVVKYFLNVFLANHMTQEFYGDFSVALRTLEIAATTLLLGTNISAVRYLPQYINRDDQQQTKRYISWNFHLIKYSFVAMTITVLLTIFSMLIFHLLDIKRFSEHHLALYILSITPLVSMVMLFGSYLLSNNHYVLSVFISEVAKSIIIIGFFSVTILLLQIPLNCAHVIGVLLVAFIILFIFEFFLIIKLEYIPKNTFKHFKIIKLSQQNWLKSSLKLFIHKITFHLICAVDLFVVEIITPNEPDVGMYAAAIAIGGFIWLIPDNIYTLIKPKISSMICNQKEKIPLQRLLNKTNLIIYVIVGVVVSCIIVFSNFLLQNFGETYTIIQPALIILVLGYSVGVLSKSPAMIMTYGGEETNLLKITLFELGFAIVITALLTYFFGLIGTAISTGVTLIIRTILMLWVVRKKLHMKSIIIL
jgi:O-antigen/teichoic acid export membrane protein